MYVHEQGKGEVKLHSSASRQDTGSKHTHFLISHIGQPAAPQETNNGLVITPRQHTKELLTRNSSDFLPLKNMPTFLYNLCQIAQKGLPKEWRWVQISPLSFTLPSYVVRLLAKVDAWHKMIKHCTGTCAYTVCNDSFWQMRNKYR